MKWLGLLFGGLIFGIIILADTGRLGIIGGMYRIPYADKVGHFILYGILALLINLALFRSNQHLNRKLIVFRTALLLGLLIGIEEYSQQFFPNRTSDLLDLTFIYLGVLFMACDEKKTVGAGLPRPYKFLISASKPNDLRRL